MQGIGDGTLYTSVHLEPASTLGARGFSCAVSGFGQVKFLRPLAEHLPAYGRQNEASRRTREKTSGTQGSLLGSNNSNTVKFRK